MFSIEPGEVLYTIGQNKLDGFYQDSKGMLVTAEIKKILIYPVRDIDYYIIFRRVSKRAEGSLISVESLEAMVIRPYKDYFGVSAKYPRVYNVYWCRRFRHKDEANAWFLRECSSFRACSNHVAYLAYEKGPIGIRGQEESTDSEEAPVEPISAF